MGAVFLAQDTHLNRPVVVKVPHPRLLIDPTFRERFFAEIEGLQKLDHPHVVRILDKGEHDGLPFAVLQYLGGGSVADRARAHPKGRLSASEVLPWLRQIAKTIDFIDGQGIVHRDIKPTNILFDEHGNAYLTDFGVAKSSSRQSDLTGIGSMPGTPSYMAPEQALSDELTSASDQYALATTVYHVLSGRLPFAGDTPLAVVLRKQQGVATALSEVVPEIPLGAAASVMRAMSPDASARYPSCQAFVGAFERGLRGETPRGLHTQEARLTAQKRERKEEPNGHELSAGAMLAGQGSGRSSKRPLFYIAAGSLIVVAAALVGLGGVLEEEQPVDVEAEVWRLIAKREFDTAIARLRKAREANPTDASLSAPLAEALERAADRREKAGDVWRAQAMLQEASKLEPSPRRAWALARVKAAAVSELDSISVELPAVTADPVVTVDNRLLQSFVVDGRELGGTGFGPESVRYVLASVGEGPHELAFVMTDRAGNERVGSLVFVVDRTPPVVEILEPRDGVQFRSGSIPVRVRVVDENPGATVVIGDHTVPLKDGEAPTELELGDGEHVIEVVALDRAGHKASASRTIVVDSKSPDLRLTTARIVTRDGRIRVGGSIRSQVEQVTVDGRPVVIEENRSFATDLLLKGDRTIPVVAIALSGLRRELSVEVLFDDRPPRIGVSWERRDQQGTLLCGTKELDAGALLLPLDVDDKTRVTFLPEQGRVEGNIWYVPVREGRLAVGLRALDEAGNETELGLDVEGHRAEPRLSVKCSTKEITNDTHAQLKIEADHSVLVQGEPREPGRLEVPLPEGEVELVVQAIDRYGNEIRWSRKLAVDRTAPKVELEGDPERGIGRQELVFTSDEPLRSITCVGKTVRATGRSARIETSLWRHGIRRLHLVAKDLAGNTTKATLAINVKDRALVLDSQSAVQVALPASVRLDDFTVECWMCGLEPDGTSAVLSNLDDNTAGFAFMWSNTGDVGIPYAVLHAAESERKLLPPNKIAWESASWTHLALTYNGNHACFYVNGRKECSVALRERFVSSSAPLYVGRAPGGQKHYLRGAIDEVRISSVVRYKQGYFVPPRLHKEDQHTVLLLRFDVLRDGLFPDTSGHGYHGRPDGNPRLKSVARLKK
jgi:hypothetical protein